jgi:hypothetical protein
VANSGQRKLGVSEGPGTGADLALVTARIPIMLTKGHNVPDSYLPEYRIRKKSRSMDSLRTASHFGHLGQPGALNSDWAEISSSTASLENASTIHIDGDNNSIGKQYSIKRIPAYLRMLRFLFFLYSQFCRIESCGRVEK